MSEHALYGARMVKAASGWRVRLYYFGSLVRSLLFGNVHDARIMVHLWKSTRHEKGWMN
jgi:hypothetical protein